MSELHEGRDENVGTESGLRGPDVPGTAVGAAGPERRAGRVDLALIAENETNPIFDALAAEHPGLFDGSEEELLREPEPWGLGPTPLTLMMSELMSRLSFRAIEAVEAEVQGGSVLQAVREAETVVQPPVESAKDAVVQAPVVRPVAKDATVQFSVVALGTGT